MRKRIAGDCRSHGFYRGECCPQCAKEQEGIKKDTLYITTYDWVKQGTWEHIDPTNPNMRFSSKSELKAACERRGLLARAFMKPKSQGKGYEHGR